MKNKKKVITTKHFIKTFKGLPESESVREETYQKIDLYLANPRHPSLRVKKIKGTDNIWEMSITMNYRITFEETDQEVYVRKIGTHYILNHP